MDLSEKQRELCTTSRWDFTDLRALYVNCTLKPSPDVSNTQGLIDLSIAIMEANGVVVDRFRAVDYLIAPGVFPADYDRYLLANHARFVTTVGGSINVYAVE